MDDRGGSTPGVAGSPAVVAATLFEAMGRLANLHTPVKAGAPIGVVRIPTFARAHFASDEWQARGLTRQEAQRTHLPRCFATRMAGCNAYRMVGRVAPAPLSPLWLPGRLTSQHELGNNDDSRNTMA